MENLEEGGGGSKRALRFSLLDLGSSRVRVKSGRPGDLRGCGADSDAVEFDGCTRLGASILDTYINVEQR
jgi:hypothetical protein